MDTLYTNRLHGFPNFPKQVSGMEPAITEEGVLSLLIVLGSSISLVGLVFAFITYSLFSDLRNLSGTALMNLLAALFMTQLLYVIGVGGVSDHELCISLAFSLQYVRLCVLFWLIVITHHMYQQFNTHLYSLIPQPESAETIGKQFYRYSIFAWGCPGVFLGLSGLLQYSEEKGNLLNTSKLTPFNCWFLGDTSFLLCHVVPSALCFCITLWYLFKSSVAVYKAVSIQLDRKIRDKMLKKRKLQILLFIKISLVVYGSLTIGILYKFIDSDWTRISYHVIQGLQGILAAVLVTCNCQVLKLYTKSIKTTKRQIPHLYGGVDSKCLRKSTSLQLLTWEPPPDIV